MKITETLRGAMRRVGGRVSAKAGDVATSGAAGERRTAPLPSILDGYGFARSGWMQNSMPKATPANLRRFAETPVARKAINSIKDRIAGMRWRIQAKRGRALEEITDGAARARILTDLFEAPNPEDSFRSMAEQALEDVIVGGFGALEVSATEDAAHPLMLWPVDGATIRMRTDWDGLPGSPRYVQVTGQLGPEGNVVLRDDELIYIRLNPRTHTPFGLGRMEVAFETINAFLSAHKYASRLASNSVVQYALWLQNMSPEHHERLIRWWQDEIEGTGRVPILSVESKPEVLRFGGGTDADLRLAWQEFLVRVIANAFDLPPQFLGVERDVNRSTATEMTDAAFQQAIVPTARLFAESLTRGAISKKLGWNDLEFVFTDLDAHNEMEQAQIDEILLRSGVLTVNEVRRARGLTALGPQEEPVRRG
jgi:HK97 family phage portal protein